MSITSIIDAHRYRGTVSREAFEQKQQQIHSQQVPAAFLGGAAKSVDHPLVQVWPNDVPAQHNTPPWHRP